MLEVETRAFRAWPAAEVEGLGGWRLRATGGPTRRANSVWPGPDEGGGALAPAALATRIARVERFYGERGLAPRFQLFPGVAPPDLDAELERRGWLVEAPVSVQVAAASVVAEAAPGGAAATGALEALAVEVAGAPTPAWWSVAGEQSRFASEQEGFRALLARLPGRVGYALVRERGEPAATGLGVVDGGWLGVFAMLTLPEHRRRGAARAALAALARFAGARHGAPLPPGRARERAGARALRERGLPRALRLPLPHAPGRKRRRWPRIALRRRLRPA